MDKLAALFKALADRNRLRIVGALLQYEELCACQIIELMQVTGATVSRHMGVLLASGLIGSRKDGRWVHYRLCRDRAEFTPFVQWLETRLANDTQLRGDMNTLAEILACDPEDISRRQREESSCLPNSIKV
jgi:ArsR family transcriptional regulator, arsenate/arsenite/antimonite-responsive transcriptional repressor